MAHPDVRAVGVDLWHERRQRASDCGRVPGDYAREIVVIEFGPEIIFVDHVGKIRGRGHAGNRRERDAFRKR